ncbi:hypothetical protein [Kitasatospora sp. NPDC088134]|uniref:hypothetical protein n=1 Tax=Kitasatospora sp. NPDC088134 TaxID=3364071 RepID=UPI0037F16F63
MSVTAPEKPVAGLRITSYAPTLLVLKAVVVHPWGKEEFALAMPTAPQGNSAWQCARIALYLDALNRETIAPGAAGLSSFLRSDPGAPVLTWDYPFEAQNDERVECLLNLVLKPGSEGDPPGMSLAVVEREPGPAGFYRRRFWGSAREIADEAAKEIEGEAGRLASLAGRFDSRQMASLAEEASDLARRIEPVRQALRIAGQRAGRSRAQAASNGTAVEPEQRRTVLLPQEESVVLTGTVVHVAKPVEDEGETVGRLVLDPDADHRRRLAPVIGPLTCRLAGALVEQVDRARLRPGDRVTVCGRLEVRHYRASDDIPRSVSVFVVEGFGFGAFPVRP